MATSRYLRKGSVVTISLIPNDNAVTPGMLKYDGQIAQISRICRPSRRLQAANGTAYGYELDGIVSDFGVPYTFTNEMIFKEDE